MLAGAETTFRADELEGVRAYRYAVDTMSRRDPEFDRRFPVRSLELKGLRKDAFDLRSHHRSGTAQYLRAGEKLRLNPAILYWLDRRDLIRETFIVSPISIRERGDEDIWIAAGAIEVPNLFDSFYYGMHTALMSVCEAEMGCEGHAGLCDVFKSYWRSHVNARGAESDKDFFSRRMRRSNLPRVASFLARKLSAEPGGRQYTVDDLLKGLLIFFNYGSDHRLSVLYDERLGLYIVPTSFEEGDEIADMEGNPLRTMEMSAYRMMGVEDGQHAAWQLKTSDKNNYTGNADAIEAASAFWDESKDELERHFRTAVVGVTVRTGRLEPDFEESMRKKTKEEQERRNELVLKSARIGAIVVPEGFEYPYHEIRHMLGLARQDDLAAGRHREGVRDILERWAEDPEGFRPRGEVEYARLADFLCDTFNLSDVTTKKNIVQALKICFNEMGARESLPLLDIERGQVAANPRFARVRYKGRNLTTIGPETKCAWHDDVWTSLDYWRRRAILLKRRFEIAPFGSRIQQRSSHSMGALIIPRTFADLVSRAKRAMTDLYLSSAAHGLSEEARKLLEDICMDAKVAPAESALVELAQCISSTPEANGDQLSADEWLRALIIYTNYDHVLEWLPLYNPDVRTYFVPDHMDNSSSYVRGLYPSRTRIFTPYDTSVKLLDVLTSGAAVDRRRIKSLVPKKFTAQEVLHEINFIIDRALDQLNTGAALALMEKIVGASRHFGSDSEPVASTLAHLVWRIAKCVPTEARKEGANAALKLLKRMGYSDATAGAIGRIFPVRFPIDDPAGVAACLKSGRIYGREAPQSEDSGDRAAQTVPHTVSAINAYTLTKRKADRGDVHAEQIFRGKFTLTHQSDLEHLIPGANYGFGLTSDKKIIVCLEQKLRHLSRQHAVEVTGVLRFSKRTKTAFIDVASMAKRIIPLFHLFGLEAKERAFLRDDPIVEEPDDGTYDLRPPRTRGGHGRPPAPSRGMPGVPMRADAWEMAAINAAHLAPTAFRAAPFTAGVQPLATLAFIHAPFGLCL